MLSILLDHTPQHQAYSLQIVEQVQRAIATGQLLPGTRLPASRQLAKELGLARRTVVLAYEELCAQGYCISRTSRGTTVAAIPVLQQNPAMAITNSFPKWLPLPTAIAEPQVESTIEINFAPSVAQVNALPKKAMQQAFQKAIDQITAAYPSFEKSNGEPRLIERICQDTLPARGIEAEPDQILITNGSQCAASLFSRLITSYGGSISYGVPGYLEIPHQFTSLGFTGIPCPVDAEGMQLTEAAHFARLHYVMPEHHFPQGVTLSPARRHTLLQVAEEQDALILEDDYDSEFYYDRHPLPALKAQDVSGRVIYLGTFSKVLFNGLRLGYIVAHPEMIRQLRDLHWFINRGTSVLLQLWVAELLELGAVNRHLRRMRTEYRHKRDLIAHYLVQIFPDWRWQLPKGGMQFWIELPPTQAATEATARLAQKGVRLHPSTSYCEPASGVVERNIILGFGGITELDIRNAFEQLIR